jgi:hypothetical protein
MAEVSFPVGAKIFLFFTMKRLDMGPTQPLIHWIPGLGHEADHQPPSSAWIKDAWSYTSTPPYVFLVWCFIKHRNNFIFYLYSYTVKNLI